MFRSRGSFALVFASLALLSVLPAHASPGGPGVAAPAPQCDDTIDNNGNGFVDLDDPYCRAAQDNDESSFGSGVPGDDLNAPSSLDCWFDFNTGSGDDDCDRHACCDIDGECPADLEPESYDSGACAQTATCVETCAPLTHADRDCYCCCDVCVPGTTTCRTVYVNPVVSPECSLESLTDTASCRPCVRDTACAGEIVHRFSDGFETDDTSLWSDAVGVALP